MDLTLCVVVSKQYPLWEIREYQLARVYEDLAWFDAKIFRKVEGCTRESFAEPVPLPAGIKVRVPDKGERDRDPYGIKLTYWTCDQLQRLLDTVDLHPRNREILEEVISAHTGEIVLYWH